MSSKIWFFSVQVKRKNSPVIDADVEALIVAGNKKWTVKLLDNGNGGQRIRKCIFVLSLDAFVLSY